MVTGACLLVLSMVYAFKYFFRRTSISYPYISERSRFGDWWHDFPDKMQDFYDSSKIVHWLECYNIKNPTNNIGFPQQNMNIAPICASNSMNDNIKSAVEKGDILPFNHSRNDEVTK